MIEAILRAYCREFHPDPMWPIHGQYLCPKCLRSYPVQWGPEAQPAVALAELRTEEV